MRLWFTCFLLLAAALPASAQTEAAPAEAVPSDPRVTRALDVLTLVYDIEENGDYRVDFELDDGRKQTVWIRPSTRTFESFEVREVFSISHAPGESEDALPDSLLVTLLEENTTFGIGAWTLEERAVLFISWVDADLAPDDLLTVIELTMHTADDLEEQLTGTTDAF